MFRGRTDASGWGECDGGAICCVRRQVGGAGNAREVLGRFGVARDIIIPLQGGIDNVDTSLYDDFMLKNDKIDKIPTAFLDYLMDNPEAHVVAIVRCQELRPDYMTAAESAGLAVERELHLIRGMVVEGCASDLLQLSEESWVLRVDPDESVHTMRLEASQ